LEAETTERELKTAERNKIQAGANKVKLCQYRKANEERKQAGPAGTRKAYVDHGEWRN
jgi:hypothetical protein